MTKKTWQGMKKIILLIAVFLFVFCACAHNGEPIDLQASLQISFDEKEEVFPQDSFSDYATGWYTAEMRGAKEPSLHTLNFDEPNLFICRFLYLRSFDLSICIRVHIDAVNMQGIALYKEAADESQFHEKEYLLDTEQCKQIIALFNKSNFWKAKTRSDDDFGVDGSTWIIEGKTSKKYHAVERWSPEDAGVAAIGYYLLYHRRSG